MTQKLQTLGLIALVATIAGVALYLSDVHTIRLSRIAECVAVEAEHQGYAGNPYSADAWDTFAPLCN